MNDAANERFPEIRDAVRASCASFPPGYHREVDRERAYPISGLPRSF